MADDYVQVRRSDIDDAIALIEDEWPVSYSLITGGTVGDLLARLRDATKEGD